MCMDMILKPIKPFEPVSTESIPEGEEWISQIKWDGVRILVYYDGKETKLYNRRKNERTNHFPEIADVSSYCKAESVILDGEVIALGENGRPSFRQVMRRDALRRLDRVEHMRTSVPVYYMIFDIVYCNGKWVNELPLKERISLLEEIIVPSKQIQLTTSKGDGDTLFEVTRDQGMEGIVVKNLHSKYKIEGKDNNWQKVKNMQDIIAAVGGVTYRNNVVNSLLLGMYDTEGNFIYIGHAGTGKLKRAEWVSLTKLVEPLKREASPFSNKPERIKQTQWLKPELTVKIQYIEWPQGRSVRQPSIQSFMNIPPEECILPEEQIPEKQKL